MFRFRALEYAPLSVTNVASRSDGKPGPGVPAAHIAQTDELPTFYAGKIMGRSSKAQILRSDRGPNGGFPLARAADKITFPFVCQEHTGTAYRIHSVWNSRLKSIAVHPRRKASP